MLLINLNLYLTLNILLIWLFVLTSHRHKTFCWCLMFISWRAASLGVGNVVPCPDATLVRKYCSYLTLAHTHARSLQSKSAGTHMQITNTLWKNQQTQKWWLETKNTARRTNGAMERNDGKKDLGRDAWKERRRSLIASRTFRGKAKRRGRENNTQIWSGCAPTLRRRRIPLEKKVYKMKSI